MNTQFISKVLRLSPALLAALTSCSSEDPKTTSTGTTGDETTANAATTSNSGTATTSSAGPTSGGASNTTSAAASTTATQGTSGPPTSASGANTTTATAASSSGTSSGTDASTGEGGAASTVATVSSTSSGPTGPCSTPEVRVTDVTLPTAVIGNGGEGDTERLPMAIAAKPSGGSTLAWLGEDDMVHIADLDADDQITGTPFAMPAVDLADIAAEDTGGVVVITRDAEGGGTLNCGTPANLCDGGPNPAIPCYDMWMVRFDNGAPGWATKLTTASDSLPPYSTGPSGPTVNMIWWYQHHGRIATDGTNYATYFCNAISVSESGCINIHEGDRMQVVGPSGDLVDHPDAFGGGCSHSWNTRIVWDEATGHFVMVCATDNANRVARPAPYRTIMSTSDIGTTSVGDLVLASGGGYWVSVSYQETLRILHFDEAEPDQDIEIGSADFSHLVSYGANNMVIAWESGSGMTAQVRSAADGSAVSTEFEIAVTDHRYQAFKSFPDGSVAYPGQGSSSSSIEIARVMPCDG